MGSHRNTGLHHVSVLDDHDHVYGEKIRFSVDASSDHQVIAGVALQLFTLGFPCIYYGTEQAFSGPEPSERQWLPRWKESDVYLREAMFGPEYPRRQGRDGLAAPPASLDPDLPGFGPFGTSGHHCFDSNHSAYIRIASLIDLRSRFPVLRYGRQYQRQISFLGRPFDLDYGPGEIVAWSRILNDEEALCLLNSHGTQNRGADIVVDADLNRQHNTMQVILNTAQAVNPAGYAGPYPMGTNISVNRLPNGTAFVSIRNVSPSEVLVLTNQP